MAENVKSIEAERKKRQSSGLPSGEHLNKQAEDFGVLKADMDEARSEMGELVKKGENDRNIHRKAFKQTMQIKRMDDTKRAEYLRHLFHYIDHFGLNDQIDMFEGSGEAEPETASVN